MNSLISGDKKLKSKNQEKPLQKILDWIVKQLRDVLAVNKGLSLDQNI